MPRSHHYYAKDIVSLAKTAIELSGVNPEIKTQSKRKYYAAITNFVNEKAARTRNRNLPDDYHLINDYRFFINNYERHLEDLAKDDNLIVTATTNYVNTLVRCTEMLVTPVLCPSPKRLTTNDLVDKWTMVFRRQNDLKGYNTTAEITHERNGKQLNLKIKKKQYKGNIFRQHDYFIATIKQGDVDLVIRINEKEQQQNTFFTGTFMGKLPVYNQYPTGELFMIRASA